LLNHKSFECATVECASVMWSLLKCYGVLSRHVFMFWVHKPWCGVYGVSTHVQPPVKMWARRYPTFPHVSNQLPSPDAGTRKWCPPRHSILYDTRHEGSECV